MKFIDKFLDQITMYRLVLYYLIGLVAYAFLLTLFGSIHFTPIALLTSVALFIFVSYVTNKVFAYAFAAPTNVESVYITALILVLIFTPPASVHAFLPLMWVAVWANASKYILALGKKHVFNPAAVAAVITGFFISQSASWWVGTLSLLPVTLFGVLIVRKLRLYRLQAGFLLAACGTMLLFSLFKGMSLVTTFNQIVYYSPLFFLAFVMLTEPLTTPPTKKLQGIYGALVGVLFAPQLHFGSFYTTPEIALIVGNVFSYLVSPKGKIIATFKDKIQLTPGLVDFVFQSEKKIDFIPGQYMEWTLAHAHTDTRGNRRYFTIASSPTENDVRLGIKFYPHGSSFKKALLTGGPQTQIVGGQLSGDFVLPTDPNKKIVFIAGGIGITPFRSMIKYLVDTKQKRPLILFFANKTADEIIYRDVFDQAEKELGIKVVYTLTDKEKLPTNWQGKVGRIDAHMIAAEVPDYAERTFYLSGPHGMVVSYEETLKSMGVHQRNIKKDFFPGY